MTAYLVDTNVLLRTVHRSAIEYPFAVKAVSSLLERGESLFLTAQVLIEFWSVATRPVTVNGFGWSPEIVVTEIDQLIDQFPLLEETSEVFTRWLQLVTARGIRGKQVHDTRLVAVMQTHGVTHLLTFNIEDFKNYPGITPVHPNEV